MSVLLETSLGDIVIDLYTDERPTTCFNFLKLCKTKHYNYCLFHTVRRNFTAQCGDPQGGGQSIFGKLHGAQARYFQPEKLPKIKHDQTGTVSMVNNDHGMCGAQFFITIGEKINSLDDFHTVFGQVCEGFDVLTKINDALCDFEHKPFKDIRLNHTVILYDPFDDPAELEVPPKSPLPSSNVIWSDRIAAHEAIDETEGMTNSEDCENAYFKMNNVLIDDRRIRVDFSQSVSKKK